MTRHHSHRMHDNSKAAYAASDFSEREQEIISVLTASSCALTDREVAERLDRHRSEVQPRISEMIKDHILCEAGEVKCATTKKNVRTVAIAVPVQQGIA